MAMWLVRLPFVVGVVFVVDGFVDAVVVTLSNIVSMVLGWATGLVVVFVPERLSERLINMSSENEYVVISGMMLLVAF